MYKSLQIQPIPYQGSKRKIAPDILSYIPKNTKRIVEPFAGSAAISLAAAANGIGRQYVLNDIYEPLIQLWNLIINDPVYLCSRYEELWNEQLSDPKEFFNLVRERFNRSPLPEDFLYILARAVKNAIRFNSKGEFNQSADNRRLGKSPQKMSTQIMNTSKLLHGKVILSVQDYEKILDNADIDDIIYMDPPYTGTSNTKNPRYYQGLDLKRFIKNLYKLDKRGISYIISFDGRLGDRVYGEDLPNDLNVNKVEINAGRSAQATLSGKNEVTIESLYVSKNIKID